MLGEFSNQVIQLHKFTINSDEINTDQINTYDLGIL